MGVVASTGLGGAKVLTTVGDAGNPEDIGLAGTPPNVTGQSPSGPLGGALAPGGGVGGVCWRYR